MTQHQVRQGAKKVVGSDPLTNSDLNLLTIALGALRTMPFAENIDDEILLAIAERAVAQEKLQDLAWVEQQVKEALSGDQKEKPQNTGTATTEKNTNKPDPKLVFQEFLSRITPHQAKQPTTIDDLAPMLAAHKEWARAAIDPSSPLTGGRANLSGFDLSGFDLSGVDLRGANCTGTSFVNAVLDKACFISADLSHADFSGATLTGAQFRRAKLHHTRFQRADISGADFKLADCKYVHWPEPSTEPTPDSLADAEAIDTDRTV